MKEYLKRVGIFFNMYVVPLPIGDNLNFHNGMKFSTPDQDNDRLGGSSCANTYHGAWWYNDCFQSNLNGRYIGRRVTDAKSMNWSWATAIESLKTSRMMIRSVQS